MPDGMGDFVRTVVLHVCSSKFCVNTCKGLEHLLMSTVQLFKLIFWVVDEAAVIEKYINSPPFFWNKMFSEVLHVSVRGLQNL